MNKSLRTQIEQAISFAIQGTVEYNQKDIEDYYRNRSSWIETQADQILTAIRVGLEAKFPKKLLLDKPENKYELAKRKSFNHAIDEVKLIIKEML